MGLTNYKKFAKALNIYMGLRNHKKVAEKASTPFFTDRRVQLALFAPLSIGRLRYIRGVTLSRRAVVALNGRGDPHQICPLLKINGT